MSAIEKLVSLVRTNGRIIIDETLDAGCLDNDFALNTYDIRIKWKHLDKTFAVKHSITEEAIFSLGVEALAIVLLKEAKYLYGKNIYDMEL